MIGNGLMDVDDDEKLHGNLTWEIIGKGKGVPGLGVEQHQQQQARKKKRASNPRNK